MVFSIFANPHRFMGVSAPFAWVFTLLGASVVAWGVYAGLYLVPTDYRQQDAARIMFVHVPAMWLSLFAYAFMVGASVTSIVWRHSLADVAAKSAAPIGLAFTVLGLITGSIWAKPIWNTWWEWDARITSVLLLAFIYLGYIAVWQAMDSITKAARAAAILCLVGAINLPVIHYSVDWWNSLHQKSSFMTDSPDRTVLTRALGLDGATAEPGRIDAARETKAIKAGGLAGGDVILAINATRLGPDTLEPLRLLVMSGEALEIAYQRDGKAQTTRYAAKVPPEFKYPMYIIALGYLSLFGGLTLFNMRAEILARRADMLAQRKLAMAG